MSDTLSDWSKGDIIVVDDTPINLRLLSAMLNERGYKVRSVINGPMALSAAQLAPPDLILLDINMPGMNGYEVCHQLKQDERTRDIPVLFISALDEILDKVKAFRSGGVDYITKPFHLEEVLARVETHLTLRRLQLQLQETNNELERRVAERTAELARLNAAYERFVPREFLSLLNKENIIETELGDQVQQEMTVMFADIRSFTMLSEHMTPQENFNFINSYLKRVSPIIRQHRGLIDKYLGDGIMALFPHHPEDALRASIAMLTEVQRYNHHRQSCGYQPISVGFGLHTGRLMLGIIGEEKRMQGTVIADAVNVASRMEGLTKKYGASIIISEQSLQMIEDRQQYHARFVDKVQVNGKREPLSVFEVFDGEPEPIIALKQQTQQDFEQGLELYYARRFSESSVKFHRVLEQNPDDKAALLYLERAARFLVQGVPGDWTGIEIVTEK